MILTFRCTFGVPLSLQLEKHLGSSVEIECLEFVAGVPSAWRLLAGDQPLTPWRTGIPDRKTLAFHDLQIPHRRGTRGTPGAAVTIETHGIGEATVLVWPREGTFPQSQCKS